MQKKFYCLFTCALALCLVQNAPAQVTDVWTGLAGDGLWTTPGNWSGGVWVPDPCVVWLTPTNGTSVVTIGPGEHITVCCNGGTGGTIYGPEWGMTLNIYGSLSYCWYLIPVQSDSANPSTINLYDNGFISGEGLALGYNWWWNGGPYCNLNIRSNAVANLNWLWWGGKVNLYGGMLHITNGVVNGTAGLVSDATRHLNLEGGKLILPASFTTTVNSWITRGILFAYGKKYQSGDITINESDTNYPSQTVVTTTPLGGALQSVHLYARTNMMVGTFQQTPLLGDYPNVTNVVLSYVDPTTVPTPTYQSSDSSVVSVITAGLLTALKPGTATIYATSGVFSASSVITVTPFTNSLVHRYSFSESGGSTTADSAGGSAWDGTLYGGATLTGGTVVLDGSSGYVQLPAGIVSNLDAVTVEAWVNFGTPAGYATLFAFGDQNSAATPQGKNYIAFQPFTGLAAPTAAALFGKGDPGNADEQDAVLALVSGGATNLLGNVHLAVVYHPYAGYVSFYTNGVLAAINSNVSNPLAATLGTDPTNWLGQSLYASDPFLKASIDEFRIYNGPLMAGQIAADEALGPGQLIGTSRNVSLSASLSGNSAVISWPATSALVSLMSSPALGAGASWSAAGGTLTVVGANYRMTVPIAGSTRFFRLQQ